jgi:hypothetical protein
MSEEKILYVAYTNTDCTEGRGTDVPIATCESEITAKRLAKRRYIQGSDGPVREISLLQHDGKWYAPLGCINIIPPSDEDKLEIAAIAAKNSAMDKARAAGLTDDDIKALIG